MGDWQAIEVKVKMIQAKINGLTQEKEATLRLDDDYAEYLDAFRDSGDGGQPLSIRRFHALAEEYEQLHQGWAETGYSEDYWKKRVCRMVELEKLLCI